MIQWYIIYKELYKSCLQVKDFNIVNKGNCSKLSVCKFLMADYKTKRFCAK